MTNEEYFAIAVDVFPVPANPGPSAAVVAVMTAAVIAETTRLHREATQVYRTYHNVDQAIKKLIIESFDDAYPNALSDESVGYANCKSLQLLLLTYYAMIAPTELTQNYERLNTPYDPNQPIESLFQHFQDARAFAVAGALYLLVLTVSGSKVGLELCPSFFSQMFFIPPAAGAHEVPSCKYVGVSNVDLLWVSNEETACIRVICTILNMLEQGFNRLLGIPCSAHVFKVDFQIIGGDVAVSAEKVVQHVPS
jgi:hypothetical protein